MTIWTSTREVLFNFPQFYLFDKQNPTMAFPNPFYQIYEGAALLAGAQAFFVASRAENNFAVDWDSVPEAVWAKTQLVFVCSPGNPTGAVMPLEEWQKLFALSDKYGFVLASDECYLSFAKDAKSILALSGGQNTGLLAVHSLSKRSNLAGYRGAFVAGDSKLIARLLEIRKHMGMMVPLPIQKATTVALADEVHVLEQSERYRRRRANLRRALESQGFTIEFSEAGLYLWCTRNEDAWESVAWLANRGILATPGSFYGSQGARHIRIAMTATDAQIADAVQRIRA